MTLYQTFKKALAEKLADEGTCFTAKDIKKVKDTNEGFYFTVKGYEHIIYRLEIKPENDDYFYRRFGYFTVGVSDNDNEGIYLEWYRDYNEAMIHTAKVIGYHIANTY